MRRIMMLIAVGAMAVMMLAVNAAPAMANDRNERNDRNDWNGQNNWNDWNHRHDGFFDHDDDFFDHDNDFFDHDNEEDVDFENVGPCIAVIEEDENGEDLDTLLCPRTDAFGNVTLQRVFV